MSDSCFTHCNHVLMRVVVTPLHPADWAAPEPQRLTWGCEGDHRGKKTHKAINISWWRRSIWWRWLPVISTSLQPVFLSLSVSCSPRKDNIIFLIKGFYIDGNKEGWSLSPIVCIIWYKWKSDSMYAAAAPLRWEVMCSLRVRTHLFKVCRLGRLCFISHIFP